MGCFVEFFQCRFVVVESEKWFFKVFAVSFSLVWIVKFLNSKGFLWLIRGFQRLFSGLDSGL